MQTDTHIHPKAAPGLTLAETRRPRRPVRYPDDPVGNPETTDGGW
jgi:hypothetical protein